MSSGQVLGAAASLSASSPNSLMLTTDPGHLRAAQRLRHEVFRTEFGRCPDAPGIGLDADRFDWLCDHLVVRENASGDIAHPSGSRGAAQLPAAA